MDYEVEEAGCKTHLSFSSPTLFSKSSIVTPILRRNERSFSCTTTSDNHKRVSRIGRQGVFKYIPACDSQLSEGPFDRGSSNCCGHNKATGSGKYQRTTRVVAKFFFMYSPRLTSAAPIPMRPAKCIHDTYIHDATSRRGLCFLVAGTARGGYSH